MIPVVVNERDEYIISSRSSITEMVYNISRGVRDCSFLDIVKGDIDFVRGVIKLYNKSVKGEKIKFKYSLFDDAEFFNDYHVKIYNIFIYRYKWQWELWNMMNKIKTGENRDDDVLAETVRGMILGYGGQEIQTHLDRVVLKRYKK